MVKLMKKEWKILSTTQAQFLDYINENTNRFNRIILYKHRGHFGSEYAIRSRFKNAEILNLKQLKSRKGKNLFFRIIHIAAAVIAFFFNERKTMDARTTITTVLNNMENIYLGIDKEKEYLKYLHIKKYARKDGKIKFFIRIEEKDIETDEDVQCFRILTKLIKSKKINNTVLLVSGERINLMNLGINMEEGAIPIFQLTEADLVIIAKENEFEVTKKIGKNIDLIQKLGLQFFIDNYVHFDALSKIQADNFDWIQKMEWLINQINKRNESTDRQLYSILEFSSFFENNFSKIDIQDFNNNVLDTKNLDIAQEMALITKERSSNYTIPTYYFSRTAFKIYFATRYISDLEPIPRLIYSYFREKYPFKYIPALNVLHVDSSFIDYKEKQSLTIIGYYFQNFERGVCNANDFLRLTTKGSTASLIIKLFEHFKYGTWGNSIIERLPEEISKLIDGLEQKTLDIIASCAAYVIILQILKEDYLSYPDIDFSEILGKFRAAILNIESIDDYHKYWQIHFRCQYIALSLEDENVNESTAKRFLDDVQENRKSENFRVYISENKLRGFSKIDLLAYSLGFNNAGKILQELYLNSERSSILKELARINYSAFLIENGDSSEAEKILREGNKSFLENINIDTYCGYVNNLYLAQLINGTINIDDFVMGIKDITGKSVNGNDKLIILNNLSVAYLKDGENANEGVNQLNENMKKGNAYNRFLAVHNLLAYYYTNNDSTHFNSVYNEILVPKLLLSDKTFFLSKLKWMKENIGQTSYEDFSCNVNVPQCYNQLYLFSTIERWFE